MDWGPVALWSGGMFCCHSCSPPQTFPLCCAPYLFPYFPPLSILFFFWELYVDAVNEGMQIAPLKYRHVGGAAGAFGEWLFSFITVFAGGIALENIGWKIWI